MERGIRLTMTNESTQLRQLHPMASPIIDSYDLLSRLREHFSTTTHDDWKCSTIDFSAMYTRVTWEHTLHTFEK